MLQCNSRVFGGTNMASAKFFRRQAATCAGLAAQTHDEESCERLQRLEQTYLRLAETEEHQLGGMNASTGKTESGLAA
jgi:hypothetical protein